MSHITDIILVTMIDDRDKDSELNANKLSRFLFDNYNETPLVHVPRGISRRGMQCDVFISTVNYLDIDRFMRLFYSIEWGWPNQLQLMIKDEHDDLFTVHNYKSQLVV